MEKKNPTMAEELLDGLVSTLNDQASMGGEWIYPINGEDWMGRNHPTKPLIFFERFNEAGTKVVKRRTFRIHVEEIVE